jgi:hypothetical protein
MSTRLWLTSIVCTGLVAAVSCGDESSSPPGSTPATAGASALPPTAASTAGSSASGSTTTSSPSTTPPASTPSSSTAGAAAPAAAAGSAAPSANPNPATPTTMNPPMTPAMPATPAVDSKPTLFFLNNVGQVIRSADDGSERSVIVASAGSGPDGVAVDAKAGKVYWTNMGAPSGNDGTIMRSDLDGKNVATIVKSGGTFTPKQLKIDTANGKLYWSDREGMRVMRASVDGSNLETLVQTGSTEADRSDASHWCVGIAVDVAGGKLYWTQKGPDNGKVGTINRVALELPAGQDPAKRTDIEVLFKNLPEPIDLDLDLDKRMIYWTDRGDNTVSRAPLEPAAGFDPAARKDREILVKNLSEAIGISLDLPKNRMFYTSLGGAVGTSALDGTMPKTLLMGQGAVTGIALVELPK